MKTIEELKKINPHFLAAFFCISFLYALAAFFSSGFYHWDEYFQILEFTAFKWGKTSADHLPWEFEAQMRPWLQSFLLYPGKLVGPHLSVFLARLFLGQAYLWALLNWYLFSKKKFGIKTHFYFWGTFLLWFSPMLLVRYSSEAFSGLFLLIFMTMYLKDTKCPMTHALMGICASLAFWSRFQVGIFLFLPLFHIIFIKRNYFASLVLILSFLIICSVNVLIDTWGYGTTTLSPYYYFYENIILKKTSRFGENVWWDYLKWIVAKPTPLIGLPLIGSLCLFLKRENKNLLGWSILLFLFIHQLIAHKELRFLFPLIPFIPFLLWWFFNELNLKEKLQKYFVILNAVGCLSIFNSLHPIEDFSKEVPLENVQILSGPAPDRLAGGLNARFFYSPLTTFSETPSPFKFSRDVGTMRDSLKEDCGILYTSRPLYQLQTKFNTLKDKKRMWSLIKC